MPREKWGFLLPGGTARGPPSPTTSGAAGGLGLAAPLGAQPQTQWGGSRQSSPAPGAGALQPLPTLVPPWGVGLHPSPLTPKIRRVGV